MGVTTMLGVGFMAIAGLGGPAIGSLSSVQSNDQESFLPSGAESVKASNVAAQFDEFAVGVEAAYDGLEVEL